MSEFSPGEELSESTRSEIEELHDAAPTVMSSLQSWSREKFVSVRQELEDLRKKLGELHSLNDVSL